MNSTVRYRFAFDIGGTFTDLVLSGSDGSVHTGKVLSRQDAIVTSIVQGLDRILEELGIAPEQINEVVAGATTAVTNLIIERKGASTGLITTQGFRDVIEIGRELRYDIYDLTAVFPDPIVPRSLRMEIPERIDHTGAVLYTPPDAEIEQVLLRFGRAGVQSVAVCLLHAYRNPVHEQKVRAIAERLTPAIALSLSSEVVSEIREYERTVATVLNAYVMPRVGTYLTEIETGLRKRGIKATLQVMQSNGGIISREFGERMPIRLLESGPAAGVLGASHTAKSSGRTNVLAFDMGGTTAKACLISDGEPEITTEFEAARIHRFKKGSGLPVRLPSVDLIEIGAGGGSIAYIDQTGLLKVGPRSAGSNPGPACYALGGVEPTVTDAAVILGYLDPRGSLSGAVRLRADLAEQAIRSRVAEPLGISIIEAASGIHRIVCEHMASAAKIHAVEKGKDIRRYAMLAFGGAGPIHAREVARRARCTEILIPANAGVFSAIGLLVAPIKADFVRTRYLALSDVDWNAIEQLYEEMAGQVRDKLGRLGMKLESIEYRRTADMRYVGQGFEVNTVLPEVLWESSGADVARLFHEAYGRQYGHRLQDQSIEALNWRLEGALRVQWADMAPDQEKRQASGSKRSRPAFLPDLNEFVDTPIFAESDLLAGAVHQGPALIEQAGSTIVVGLGDTYQRDATGTIRISLGQTRSAANQDKAAIYEPH